MFFSSYCVALKCDDGIETGRDMCLRCVCVCVFVRNNGFGEIFLFGHRWMSCRAQWRLLSQRIACELTFKILMRNVRTQKSSEIRMDFAYLRLFGQSSKRILSGFELIGFWHSDLWALSQVYISLLIILRFFQSYRLNCLRQTFSKTTHDVRNLIYFWSLLQYFGPKS